MMTAEEELKAIRMLLNEQTPFMTGESVLERVKWFSQVAAAAASARAPREAPPAHVVSYALNETEQARAKAFREEMDAAWVAKYPRNARYGAPYYGAIGGAYSYIVYNTSIGSGLRVRHGGLQVERDITDFSQW